jgi:hypothetical protein
LFKHKTLFNEARILPRLPCRIRTAVLLAQHDHVIARIPPLAHVVNDSVRLFLLQMMSARFVDKDRYIVQEGSKPDRLVFLVDGAAVVCRSLPEPSPAAAKTARARPGASPSRAKGAGKGGLGSSRRSFHGDIQSTGGAGATGGRLHAIRETRLEESPPPAGTAMVVTVETDRGEAPSALPTPLSPLLSPSPTTAGTGTGLSPMGGGTAIPRGGTLPPLQPGAAGAASPTAAGRRPSPERGGRRGPGAATGPATSGNNSGATNSTNQPAAAPSALPPSTRDQRKERPGAAAAATASAADAGDALTHGQSRGRQLWTIVRSRLKEVTYVTSAQCSPIALSHLGIIFGPYLFCVRRWWR